MKKSLALTLTLVMLAGFALTACNATQGLGHDVSNAGQGISNEAAKDK